ncbi:hypothetical protein [Klebsiella variicola]|uniref:hypothetical protein n=1 Tax=Klebsiella variicola TaxID=244366 RepID=UPI0034DE9AFA
MNGNSKNAHYRKIVKSRLYPQIMGAMVHFNITMKQLATICNVSYGSLRTGLNDLDKISIERLEEVKYSLYEHVKAEYLGQSIYKSFLIRIGEMTDD